jgi:hypothetical protein
MFTSRSLLAPAVFFFALSLLPACSDAQTGAAPAASVEEAQTGTAPAAPVEEAQTGTAPAAPVEESTVAVADAGSGGLTAPTNDIPPAGNGNADTAGTAEDAEDAEVPPEAKAAEPEAEADAEVAVEADGEDAAPQGE